MLLYPATIRRDGETFVVLFPDLPFTHTNGDSRQEALSHAPDALQLGVYALMEKHEDIPLLGKPKRGTVLVGLPSVVTSARWSCIPPCALSAFAMRNWRGAWVSTNS